MTENNLYLRLPGHRTSYKQTSLCLHTSCLHLRFCPLHTGSLLDPSYFPPVGSDDLRPRFHNEILSQTSERGKANTHRDKRGLNPRSLRLSYDREMCYLELLKLILVDALVIGAIRFYPTWRFGSCCSFRAVPFLQVIEQ